MHYKAALLMLVAANAWSQAPTEQDLLGRLDLAMPEVPAAAVLGLSADSVIRPATGKDFAVGLLDGVGPDGKLQAGLAFDVRPALYLAQENFSLGNYRDENKTLDEGTTFERYKMKPGAYWTKIRASLATGRTEAGAGEADRYALGASWNIFDHGDSRLSPKYRSCVGTVLEQYNKALADIELEIPPVDPAEKEKFDKDQKLRRENINLQMQKAGAEKVAACAKDFEESHWNADSWDFGGAYYEFDTPQVESTGFALWTTYARHLGRRGQLILHARLQDDEVARSPDDANTFVLQDSLIIGLRLRWRAPGGAFLLEATRRDVDRAVGEDDNFTLGTVGYELRIAEGMWIQLAAGKAIGTDAFDNDPIYSGQLRWGKTEKSILGK